MKLDPPPDLVEIAESPGRDGETTLGERHRLQL